MILTQIISGVAGIIIGCVVVTAYHFFCFWLKQKKVNKQIEESKEYIKRFMEKEKEKLHAEIEKEVSECIKKGKFATGGIVRTDTLKILGEQGGGCYIPITEKGLSAEVLRVEVRKAIAEDKAANFTESIMDAFGRKFGQKEKINAFDIKTQKEA